MKTIQKSFIAIIAVSLLTACGRDGVENPVADGANTTLMNGQQLLLTGSDIAGIQNKLIGTGKAVATAPLKGGTESGQHFAMSLSLEEGGSVTLFSHADNALENAVEIKITRAGDKLAVSVNGQDHSTEFSKVDATQDFDIAIDIHNNEEPAHIVVWTGTAIEENEVLNLEDSGANGTGAFWGVELTNAEVSIQVADPKHDHDHEHDHDHDHE